MENFAQETLYDLMMEHPNRLVSKSFIEQGVNELLGEIEKIEGRLGITMTEERNRVDAEQRTWKYMTRSNVYNSVEYLKRTYYDKYGRF